MRKPTVWERLRRKYGEYGECGSECITPNLEKIMTIWYWYDRAAFFKRDWQRSLSNRSISNNHLEAYKHVCENCHKLLPEYLPEDLKKRLKENFDIIKEIYETAICNQDKYFKDKNTPNKEGLKYIRSMLDSLPEGWPYPDAMLEPPDWLYEETKQYL